jgi:radical SAM protein with 4Fe4S-binding SPASM domain
MEQRLKRIYIEITNICNLSCPFCPPLRREERIMEPDEFAYILKEIGPYCKNILLHVKGEPLLSPYLGEILDICARGGFLATITTNGTQISKKVSILYDHAPVIRGFNVSLQGLIHYEKWREEFLSVLAFCDRFQREYERNVVLRLWGAQKEAKMQELIEGLSRYFSLPEEEQKKIGQNRSYTIRKGLFISRAEEFLWPQVNGETLGRTGFCYGSLTQLAILCDGRVVPCCLDAEGEAALGNIFVEPFGQILASGRLLSMQEGFMRGEAVEELCRKCTYKVRFDQKAQRMAKACLDLKM